jgi:hypothetical protein
MATAWQFTWSRLAQEYELTIEMFGAMSSSSSSPSSAAWFRVSPGGGGKQPGRAVAQASTCADAPVSSPGHVAFGVDGEALG